MMNALTLALLLQVPAPQRENVLLDGVAVQAGEVPITLSEFQRIVNRARKERPPTSTEEDQRMRGMLLRDLLTLHLEEQKGQDLGLDPATIERINRANLQQDRESAGLANYLEQLRQEGKDALSDETDKQRKLLRALWEYSALGNAVAGKRATRDRTIRPGELRAIFAENEAALAPVQVQLRWLVVSSTAAGGPEQAAASCEDARRRVLAGEDLALIVEEIGVEFRDTRGLLGFLPARALPEPALWTFAEEAEITDLSEVLPITNPKTGKPDPALGYQLAELHDRKVPPEPEFESSEVQSKLRVFFTEQRDQRILGREREAMRRAGYLWINPLFGGPVPAKAPSTP